MSRKFSRDSCLRPANLSRIETALADVCGGHVGLVLTTHDDPADADESVPVRPSLKQQQADAAGQPFVRRAMELFDVDGRSVRVVTAEGQG
jgi:hypothetical protein